MKDGEIGLPTCVLCHVANSTPCQPPRAVATAPADQRDGLRQDVATADPSDGRGADGSGVDPPGGVALSRAAVAATSRGVSKQEGGKGHGKRA